jgi:predicted secreted protein
MKRAHVLSQTVARTALRTTIAAALIAGVFGLSACSTTPTSDAQSATTQKAERIADRMGRSANFGN